MTALAVRPQTGAALDRLVAPIPLAALALLVVNDHVLKPNHPGWLSGKLSDVAVLVLLPFLLVAAWDLFAIGIPRLGPPGRRALVASAIAAAALFTGIELVPWVGDAYRWGLGGAQWLATVLASSLSSDPLPVLRPVQLTHDPSDLLTLPFALVVLVRVRR
jgi:hypothetical protein